MNIKKGIILGVALWILIFFEVSALMFGFKLKQEDINYFFIHLVFLIIFVMIIGFLYFKNENKKKVNNLRLLRLKEGLSIGLVMVVVGIILDSAITIPLFMSFDYSFLTRLDILLGEAFTVIFMGVSGLIKQ
ncbi:MAG: hypothetical protein Q8N99_00345 [Nanoarchaeota archaeon]|nr:hypothetical protein [Nanoarchaeota archaeon]